MKLRSLLVIVSLSTIASSIAISSQADILKYERSKLESKNIQDKSYRNKQSARSLVGSWKASENEKGVPINIYFNVNSNGSYDFITESNEGRRSGSGNWEYSNNLLIQTDNRGIFQGKGLIKWISDDEFILTIQDNGDSYYEGVQRRFYRQQQPVAQENQQGDLYGSIAIYGYGSKYGFALNALTKQQAIDAALQFCFERSRGKCKTVLWFKNSCGALAATSGSLDYATAHASDKITAQQEALKNCNNEFCKIKVVECTDNVQP